MSNRHPEVLMYKAFYYEFCLRFKNLKGYLKPSKFIERLLRIEHGGYIISNAEKAARKNTGLRGGFPDYGLFYAVKPYYMLWVEFKVKGNRLTPKQEEMRAMLIEWGSKHVTCYSAEEGINEVIKYLKGEK